MQQKTFKTLEFDKILELLADYALSNKVKNNIMKMEPYKTLSEVRMHTNQTTQAKKIVETLGNPPLASMTKLKNVISLIEINAMLLPEQLNDVRQFIVSCNRVKSYLKKADSTFNDVVSCGYSINDLSELSEEIFKCIRDNKVDDYASLALTNIRKKIAHLDTRIKEKLNTFLRTNSKYFSETFIVTRNGHYTLPLKKEFKNQIKGTVIDSSNSGGTYFIEPSVISKMQNEISLLHIDEENEIRRILYTLTALVEDYLPSIKINIEAMEILDFLFAKAKLSLSMSAIPAETTTERKIIIQSGRHPLLSKECAVPLDFYMGDNILNNESKRRVVITGPNTGGKTVALKTVGLLSLMAQCGFHVPAKKGLFCINNRVLCDIGDGQSISENLSTFSSHIKNIINILKIADESSLVLLDELGSGTDPTEGMGLATAILEEIATKNSLLVATTHYPEIKDFAKNTKGFMNARMAFDRENLKPLYQLEIGEAGESCALYIAEQLGLSQKMINRAYAAAYNTTKTTYSPKNYVKEQRSNIPEISQLFDLHLKSQTNYEDESSPSNSSEIYEYSIGDSVIVLPEKVTGIVYQTVNDKGLLNVQIKGEKQLINHKRLKLHVPAKELYPADYDFSIIFDSVANRKSSHQMGRKHCPNLSIDVDNPK